MIRGPQLESHFEAGALLHMLKDEAFDYIRDALLAHTIITERDVQRFLLERMHAEGLTMDGMQPIVAITKNAAEPHHEATHDEIRKGELVLIDIWARKADFEENIYADITWMAYTGTTHELPKEYAELFSLLVQAREAALHALQKKGARAWEVDAACRAVLEKAGHGDAFIHRTGHPIDTAVHGKGYSIDSVRKKEEHVFSAGDLFSIEPGIYYPEKIGLRSEIDVALLLSGEEKEKTQLMVTGPVHLTITCLF